MRTNGVGIRLSLAAFLVLSPLTVSPAKAGDCVRVVRSISNFTLQGDAWMWWNRAVGHYARDNEPVTGSVLVFKRTGHMGRGHVSLVSRVIDHRTIEVDHSWLDNRGLRRGMRIVDVSGHNDWSRVRVWHEPTGQLGMREYPVYGFILPDGSKAHHPNQEPRYTVSPPGRNTRSSTRTVVAHASIRASVRPGHKPALIAAKDSPVMKLAAVLPSRKPTMSNVNPNANHGDVALASMAYSKAHPMPGRKPEPMAIEVASRP